MGKSRRTSRSSSAQEWLPFESVDETTRSRDEPNSSSSRVTPALPVPTKTVTPSFLSPDRNVRPSLEATSTAGPDPLSADHQRAEASPPVERSNEDPNLLRNVPSSRIWEPRSRHTQPLRQDAQGVLPFDQSPGLVTPAPAERPPNPPRRRSRPTESHQDAGSRVRIDLSAWRRLLSLLRELRDTAERQQRSSDLS